MMLVIQLISLAIEIYKWIVLAWVISGWLVIFRVVNPQNNAVRTVLRLLERAVEPALGPIRRLLPRTGGIDFSPLVLIAVLWLIQGFVLPMLRSAVISAGVG